MTTWLVAKAPTASDANGGSSKVIRSSGSNAIVNTTAGLTKVTSITAAWDSTDIGHGICVAGKFRLISAVTPQTTKTATTSNGSTNMTSAAQFDASMVGQAVTGPGIAANTVVTVFNNASSVTLSVAAGAGAGTGTVTFYVMLTTTGNVLMTAGTAQAWVVGGMWLTWEGSFFATNSPIVGGDSVYIGPGYYRPTVSVVVTMTSPASAVPIVGDVDGAQTGTTPGEVRFTNYLSDLFVADNVLLDLSGRTFLQFSKISFVSQGGCINGAGGQGVQFSDCYLAGAAGIVSGTALANISSDFVMQRCRIFYCGGGIPIDWVITESSSANYDMNWIFRNNLLLGCGSGQVAIRFNVSTPSAAFHGGGAYIRNNTFIIPGSVVQMTDASTFPSPFRCNIKNNRIYNMSSGVTFAPSAAAQIVEDYNYLIGRGAHGTPTTGLHTNLINSTTGGLPSLSMGQEAIWGGLVRPFGTPEAQDPGLYWGTAADSGTDVTPSVDVDNLTRGSGSARFITSGTATSGGTATLTDTGNNFLSQNRGDVGGKTIQITGGTGSGQTKIIKSLTNTVLTMFSNWATQPDNTSTYVIYEGNASEEFKCTAGSTTSATCSGSSWPVNQWVGWSFTVLSGTGNGQTGTVTSNSATVLTIPALGTGLDNTSVLMLYRKTDQNTIQAAGVGAQERHDCAQTETVVVNDGSTPLTIAGAGDHSFLVPVHSGHLTTISVYARYDSNYAGTLPQLKIDANSVIGVSAETKTMVASANTWEQLTLTGFTPTASGLVRIRVRANSTAVLGRSFFDTFAASQV